MECELRSNEIIIENGTATFDDACSEYREEKQGPIRPLIEPSV